MFSGIFCLLLAPLLASISCGTTNQTATQIPIANQVETPSPTIVVTPPLDPTRGQVTPAQSADSTPTSTAVPAVPTSTRAPATIPAIMAALPETTPNLKVAFIGDSGYGSGAEAVLRLIKAEGADSVLHQGDLWYGSESDSDADKFNDMVNNILGPAFPYFASVGNHDSSAWSHYQTLFQARLNRIPEANCTGDLGVNSSCTYKGLFFILTGPGTKGSNHTAYIRDQLAADNSNWSICSWHKNQAAMQIGGKGNSTGWGPYEECREGGAIIATGHEHSYQRTKTLSSTQNQIVDSACPDRNNLCVTSGSTFVFVSGLGGRSVRNQERCFPSTYPYGCKGEWASMYTSDQGGKAGALFIEFNVDGDPQKARGYFKDIDGNVIDSFNITSGVSVPGDPTANAGPDQTVIDSDSNNSEPVTLDSSASTDLDGTITGYVWKEGANQIATGVNPTVALAVGAHTITLTVTNNDGASC